MMEHFSVYEVLGGYCDFLEISECIEHLDRIVHPLLHVDLYKQ